MSVCMLSSFVCCSSSKHIVLTRVLFDRVRDRKAFFFWSVSVWDCCCCISSGRKTFLWFSFFFEPNLDSQILAKTFSLFYVMWNSKGFAFCYRPIFIPPRRAFARAFFWGGFILCKVHSVYMIMWRGIMSFAERLGVKSFKKVVRERERERNRKGFCKSCLPLLLFFPCLFLFVLSSIFWRVGYGDVLSWEE